MRKQSDVSDVMRAPVIFVNSHMSVFDALQVAKDHNIHHLVVIDDDALQGIVCTCDLRDASLNTPVESVMHRDVATVGADCSAQDAAQVMLDRKVGSVVVTHGRKALGIVTRLDLSEYDKSITDMMSQCRCVACGALQHLRFGSDGEYLCVSCLDRADADGWFDLGTGD